MSWSLWKSWTGHEWTGVILTALIGVFTIINAVAMVIYVSTFNNSIVESSRQTDRLISASNTQAQAAQSMSDTGAKQVEILRRQLVATQGAVIRPYHETWNFSGPGKNEFQIYWENVGHSPSRISYKFTLAKVKLPSQEVRGQIPMNWEGPEILPIEPEIERKEDFHDIWIAKDEAEQMRSLHLVFRVEGNFTYWSGFGDEIPTDYCMIFFLIQTDTTNGVPNYGARTLPCGTFKTNYPSYVRYIESKK